MEINKLIRRFLVPAPLITLIYLYKYRCRISPRAEVELSPQLRIGRDTQVSSFCKIKASDGPLQIGRQVSIGANCFIASDRGGISIGDFTMISPSVSIVGCNYRYDRIDLPICQQGTTSKGIHIGQDVWIGAGSVILDGAHIGDSVIVTPNSVVSGRLPDRTIAQGNPAKVIFQRR